MEIVDFKNFEQFQVYIKQHGEEMPYWSAEQTEKFNNKFNKLMEESPEFKEKYDHWVKQLEIKAKIEQKRIVVLGRSKKDDENNMYVKGYLKLREIQKKKKNTEDKNIVAMNVVKKKQYTI